MLWLQILSLPMNNSPIIIKKILNEPIHQSHWNELERIIKELQQYITRSSKNRQYIEAQKATDKILQATQQLKMRKIADVQRRLDQALFLLEQQHYQQSKFLQHQWTIKIETVDKQFEREKRTKSERHQQELQRSRTQMELAIPQTHSPDNDLCKLRWEEEHYAKEMKWMDAQRVKEKIDQKKKYLQQKHQKFRENNIQQMLKEIIDKQDHELLFIQGKQGERINELKQEKRKKQKDLEEKQAKQLKEAKWIYGQEMKRYY